MEEGWFSVLPWRLLLIIPTIFAGSDLGCVTAIGAVLVMVVMVAAGIIRVDICHLKYILFIGVYNINNSSIYDKRVTNWKESGVELLIDRCVTSDRSKVTKSLGDKVVPFSLSLGIFIWRRVVEHYTLVYSDQNVTHVYKAPWYDTVHSVKNIVAEVTFQFWAALINFGPFFAILDNFGEFLGIFKDFLNNFWTFQYYCSRLPQQPYSPHCAAVK